MAEEIDKFEDKFKKFKVGDQVRIVVAETGSCYEKYKYKVGTVHSITTDRFIRIIYPNEDATGAYIWRLELCSESKLLKWLKNG